MLTGNSNSGSVSNSQCWWKQLLANSQWLQVLHLVSCCYKEAGSSHAPIQISKILPHSIGKPSISVMHGSGRADGTKFTKGFVYGPKKLESSPKWGILNIRKWNHIARCLPILFPLTPFCPSFPNPVVLWFITF